MQDHRTTQSEIAELIKQVRMDPKANNKPVLGVNINAIVVAKNGGYPKHMYHEYLDPVVAISPEEQTVLESEGYTSIYVKRDHPRYLHRRNMSPKFEAEGFTESVIVQTAEAEAVIRKKPAPHTAGPWCFKVTDLEPLPDAPAEDPAVTKARLEAQVDELRKQLAGISTKAAKG